ncbi:hypothetical protein DsansV1_C35g0229761 [Dioscorea sansibarensis]
MVLGSWCFPLFYTWCRFQVCERHEVFGYSMRLFTDTSVEKELQQV